MYCLVVLCLVSHGWCIVGYIALEADIMLCCEHENLLTSNHIPARLQLLWQLQQFQKGSLQL